MTDAQLQELRGIIERTIIELRKSEESLEDASKPIEPSVALGRLTRMEAIGEKGVKEAMKAEMGRRLERLGNALKRMEQGGYGTCLRCRKEIPFGRLQAVPESLLCVSCAEKKRS